MMTRLLAMLGAVVVAKAAYEHYKDYRDLQNYKAYHEASKDSDS